MQYKAILNAVKLENFHRIFFFFFFFVLLLLKTLRVLISTHILCFGSVIRKEKSLSYTPQFFYIKVGLEGVFNSWTCLCGGLFLGERSRGRREQPVYEVWKDFPQETM